MIKKYQHPSNRLYKESDPDVQVISGPFKPSPNVQVTTNPNIRTRLLVRLSYETPQTETSKEVYPDYSDPALSFDPVSPYYYEEPQLIDDDFFNIFGLKKGGLIPRKLIGGLIPKFQKASGKLFTRLEYERRYSNRNYNKAYLLNGKWHRAILNRNKNGNETVTLQTWVPLPKNYYVKNGGVYERTELGDIRVDTYKGSRYEAGKPAPNHKLPVNHSVTLAEIDDAKKLNAGIQAAKPAGTRGNGSRGGTRGSGTRGNARTTAKPAATTSVSTPIENTGTYTIQRGDTLGAIASNLGISVDELAKLNNISNPNRIYAGRTLITKAPTVTSTNNVPNGMEYASGYLNANTPDSAQSAYNTLALNVLSDVDKRIAEIRPTISSRSAYADMEDAMSGWDLKRKLKMMDASVGTAWDWNTEEGRKNFVGMANLMKNGKGNYNKIYDQWMASLPKTNESQNETYALRFPLAYQSGLLTTPITDNLSLTTQLPVSTNQPSVGWVNTLAILDAVNRTIPQLSIGNTNNNNDFTTLELPQKNFSGFVTDLFKRKRTGNWTFAKQGTKLIRRK